MAIYLDSDRFGVVVNPRQGWFEWSEDNVMTNDPNDYGDHGEYLGAPEKKRAKVRVRFPRLLPYLTERQVAIFLACAVVCCAYVVGLMVETTESIEEVLRGPVATAVVALAALVVLWYSLWKHPHRHHNHNHQHHPR
jgi:hypothetical protein